MYKSKPNLANFLVKKKVVSLNLTYFYAKLKHTYLTISIWIICQKIMLEARNDQLKIEHQIKKMGLKISTIAAIPENVERSYYLYILDYYNWDEPISKSLRDSFDKISKFAAENDSVVIQGISESHFYSELMSWESVNGIDPKELLPALMITTIHPKYFLVGNDKQSINGKIPEDKLVFIEIGKVCKTPQDVLKLIEKVFQDIKNKKDIKDFQIKKELKGGVGKTLNDTIILEPNIAGIGVNINNLFKFLGKK